MPAPSGRPRDRPQHRQPTADDRRRRRAGGAARARCDGTDSRDAWTAVFRVAVGRRSAADARRLPDRRRPHPLHADVPARSRPAVSRDVRAARRARRSRAIVGTAGDATPRRRRWWRRCYPTADVVPENQLRLYIHFSAPMGMKGGLDYVHLLDEQGKEVKDPFLPLDAEFWNDDRTRYTVFFDPGRQKRGIPPIAEMGRSLTEGQVVHAGGRRGVARRQRLAAEGARISAPSRSARPTSGRSITKAWKIAGAGRRHARAADGRVSRAARSRTAAARVGRQAPTASRIARRRHVGTRRADVVVHAAGEPGRPARTTSWRSRCSKILPATASAARSKSISSIERIRAASPRRR